MMLPAAALPARQSFLECRRGFFCEAVVACTVVIKPLSMPYVSFRILATGARQVVVHEAQDITVIFGS